MFPVRGTREWALSGRSGPGATISAMPSQPAPETAPDHATRPGTADGGSPGDDGDRTDDGDGSGGDGGSGSGAGTDSARQLTDVVTRLRRALRSSIRTEYPWESLPMAQVELLQTLAAGPLRVGELAARQRLAPNTVSGLVGKLLDAGFVDRQTDPGDRRTARIALTEAGHRQLADWQRAHERRIADALAGLSPADRAAVMTALPSLERLARALDAPQA